MTGAGPGSRVGSAPVLPGGLGPEAAVGAESVASWIKKKARKSAPLFEIPSPNRTADFHVSHSPLLVQHLLQHGAVLGQGRAQ